MLREIAPGRGLLKLVPAAKILLSRHRVAPSLKGMGWTSAVEVLSVNGEDSGDGSRGRRFKTPIHEIALSVTAEGLDSENLTAADVYLSVKTLAGDVRLRQARIDLVGDYEILSIHKRETALVSCGGNDYSIEVIEGPIDRIIREGDRLALDISLCANWNFFGEYRLGLRITRRPRDSKAASAGA